MQSSSLHKISLQRLEGVKSPPKVNAHKPVGLGLHSQANGQAEDANREILKGVKKRMKEYKTCWVDELSIITHNAHKPVGAGLYSQANGHAEVANREIVKGVEKRMKEYKTCWVDELSIPNHKRVALRTDEGLQDILGGRALKRSKSNNSDANLIGGSALICKIVEGNGIQSKGSNIWGSQSSFLASIITLASIVSTLLCGLLMIPPSNAVVPQYHMHTKCLADLKHQFSGTDTLSQHEKSILYAKKEIGGLLPVEVKEQRVSNSLQSCVVGGYIAAMTFFELIMTSVLWELSEKKMLWDYLSLVMSEWEGKVVKRKEFKPADRENGRNVNRSRKHSNECRFLDDVESPIPFIATRRGQQVGIDVIRKFTVVANKKVVLLHEYSPKALQNREYLMNVMMEGLNINFSGLAFVNAIEVVSAPDMMFRMHFFPVGEKVEGMSRNTGNIIKVALWDDMARWFNKDAIISLRLSVIAVVNSMKVSAASGLVLKRDFLVDALGKLVGWSPSTDKLYEVRYSIFIIGNANCSGMSTHEQFSGSVSSGVPIFPFPMSNSHCAKTDTLSLSISWSSLLLRRIFSVRSRGILKREWDVRPAGSNREAIPDEATASIIFPSECIGLMAIRIWLLRSSVRSGFGRSGNKTNRTWLIGLDRNGPNGSQTMVPWIRRVRKQAVGCWDRPWVCNE
nr:probable receptor-like protein kinase At4g39110 [Tanacetum cinerariifolium]